jgi:hypothetical protein
MITIDEIEKPEYDFPTVDFKFQNSGNATAFLWQFGIAVLSAEVDITPVLGFNPTAEDGMLTLAVCNNGWGAAKNISLRLEEETLSKIFAGSSLQFHGALESGEQVIAYRLSSSDADPSRLRDVIRAHFISLDDGFSYRRGSDPNNTSLGFGIKLKDARLVSNFRNEKGNEHAEDQTVSFRNFEGWIALTPEGFVEFCKPPPMACPAPSYVTFISLIDPNRGPHERVYRMSRKIPPGDIERFHIMVGASKSCHLRIKFKFLIDKDSIIESEEFDIHVWMPRNQRWQSYYRDGTEVQRHPGELENRMSGTYYDWEPDDSVR